MWSPTFSASFKHVEGGQKNRKPPPISKENSIDQDKNLSNELEIGAPIICKQMACTKSFLMYFSTLLMQTFLCFECTFYEN